MLSNQRDALGYSGLRENLIINADVIHINSWGELVCRHYAKDALAKLKAAGIRAETDLRNEKINYKVREHSLAKVPHLLVVGKREAEEGKVAVRTLGAEHQKVITLDEALAMLVGEATPPDLSTSTH